MAEITSKLQSSLEHELVVGLDDNNTKQVHRCLNSYALISKSHDAETLVRVHVVDPFMKQVRFAFTKILSNFQNLLIK